MKENLLDKIVDRLRNLGSPFRVSLVVTLAVFFAYDLVSLISCKGGLQVCSNFRQMGMIFPFYLVVMPFIPRLNFVWFSVLFVVSSVIYLIIFYKIVGYLETSFLQKFYRRKILF